MTIKITDLTANMPVWTDANKKLVSATFPIPSGIWANVLDYGADPTGVADSTAAIQTAINTGMTVYVPDGSYLITNTLYFGTTLRAGQRLIGSDAYRSRLVAGPSCPVIMDIGVNYVNSRVEINNIGFAGNSTADGAIRMGDTTGISYYASQTMIQRCVIQGFTKVGAYGVWYRNAVETHVFNCAVYNNYYNFYVSPATMQGTSLLIDGSTGIIDGGQHAVYLDGYIHEMAIRDVAIRTNRDAAIYATANGRARIEIQNVYFENNGIDHRQAIVSATSMTLGLGAQTCVVQTGLTLPVGKWLAIYETGTFRTKQMNGQITSYNSGTGELVVNIQKLVGSGSASSWTIDELSSLETIHLIGSSAPYNTLEVKMHNCVLTGCWSPKDMVDFFGGMYFDYVCGYVTACVVFYNTITATANAQVKFIDNNRVCANGSDAKTSSIDLPMGCSVHDANYGGHEFHKGHREFIDGFTVGPHLVSRQDVDTQGFKVITGTVYFGLCNVANTIKIWRLTQNYNNPTAIWVFWNAGAEEAETSGYTNNSAGLLIASGYSTHDDQEPIVPQPVMLSSTPRNTGALSDVDYLDVSGYAEAVPQIGARRYIQDVGLTILAHGTHAGGLVTVNYKLMYTGNVSVLV